MGKTEAFVATDSRYWIQARQELDRNWHIVKVGSVDGPSDWVDWLVERVHDCKVGIDARLLSYEKATLLNTKLQDKKTKLYYPPQNLIDLIWKEKPPRSPEPVFVQPMKLAGQEAGAKIAKLRAWIKAQPPSLAAYPKGPPTPAQFQEGMLVSNLAAIGVSECLHVTKNFFLLPSSVAFEFARRRYPFQPGLPLLPLHLLRDGRSLH